MLRAAARVACLVPVAAMAVAMAALAGSIAGLPMIADARAQVSQPQVAEAQVSQVKLNEPPRFRQRQGAEAWQPKLPPCQCRAAGRLWQLGEEVCLEAGRGRMAHVCGMQQNVTSWHDTGRACPDS